MSNLEPPAPHPKASGLPFPRTCITGRKVWHCRVGKSFISSRISRKYSGISFQNPSSSFIVFLFVCFKLFILYRSIAIKQCVIVSDGQQRDLVIQIHVSILAPTPLPSRLPYHWAELPALYSRTLLVIHFKDNSVYMWIPNSLTVSSLLSSSL